MTSIARALTLSAITLLIAGCGSPTDDLSEWMRSSSSSMRGQVTPLPPVAPFTPVSYIGNGMSDPFAPKKNVRAVSTPDSTRKKEFLETFPLDKLMVVGTIQRKGILWGLVKAPDGTITMVKPGNYMGQNFGKVVSVKYSAVVLREAVLDPQGEWSERDVPMEVINSTPSK